MPWFRVDDDFSGHRKVLRLEQFGAVRQGLAIALWTLLGCESARRCTEGEVLLREITRVLAWPTEMILEAAGDLVSVGLWHEVGKGVWKYHDWYDYQPAKEEVESAKQRNRERQKNWRNKRREIRETARDKAATQQRNAVRHAVTNGVSDSVTNAVSNAVRNSVSNASPSRSPPDPDPPPIPARSRPDPGRSEGDQVVVSEGVQGESNTNTADRFAVREYEPGPTALAHASALGLDDSLVRGALVDFADKVEGTHTLAWFERHFCRFLDQEAKHKNGNGSSGASGANGESESDRRVRETKWHVLHMYEFPIPPMPDDWQPGRKQ